MQKMLIQLDEKRIIEEGRYNLKDLWEIIDNAFKEGQCIKEVQADGSVMYSGNPNRDNYLSDFGVAFVILTDYRWLAEYALKWIWYDNDDDENEPFQDTDCLIRIRKEFNMVG